MKSLICGLSAIFLLAASAAANADARSDAAAWAKAVAPFVEAETVLVARVDLTRVDVPSLLDLAARFNAVPAAQLAGNKKKATKQLAAAIQAGLREWYLVVTLRSGDQGWRPSMFGVAPIPPGADVAAIRAALNVSSGARQTPDGTLVVPVYHPTEPPGEFHPVKRPKLATAFEVAGDAAVQVALIPPDYTSRVIEEMLPQFPKELGGGPTTILTRGVRWAAAGIDLPPHLGLRLTVESADAQAAETLLRETGRNAAARRLVQSGPSARAEVQRGGRRARAEGRRRPTGVGPERAEPRCRKVAVVGYTADRSHTSRASSNAVDEQS